MRMQWKKPLAMLLAISMILPYTLTATADSVVTSDKPVFGFNNSADILGMEQIGRYNSGVVSADGGCLEIVEYNEINGFAYGVSGVKGEIIAIKISDIKNGDKITDLSGTSYKVKDLVAAANADFTYGDITSISISPDGSKLVAAVQHSDYEKNGVIAVFDCNKDGSIGNPKFVETGVQPDMVTFTPDGKKILTADEGEPRSGYGTGIIDPKGSVTIIDAVTLTKVAVDFTSYDAKRDDLTNAGVILKKGALPSEDLEPEFITCNNNVAYIDCQEANAVAVLDLATAEIKNIYSLGTVDYSKVNIDLNKNNTPTYTPDNYADVLGVRMPDGISLSEIGGKTYLLTANEGDSREWEATTSPNYYINEATKTLTSVNSVATTKKVTCLDSTKMDGLDSTKTYLFGSRSYSMFEVTDSGLKLVYDSGSDFESLTANYLPQNFNSSNDTNVADGRSNKKGPEPEYVTVGEVAGKQYAFIGLERVGGVMAYDISNPESPQFVNYINSRDFSDNIKGDVSPEGLCFIPASSTHKPLILAACEVSGTLAAYELQGKSDDAMLLYTNDAHNAYEQAIDKSGKVTSLGYASIVDYKKTLINNGYKVTLIDAGDAIQGATIGTLSNGDYIAQIMDKAGYDIAVPGNHEFDYGMSNFLSLASRVKYKYLSCNFIDLKTDKTVFDPYKIVQYDGYKVAYIGISTPETFTKSTPSYFQDEKGNYIYSFAEGNNGQQLYNTVQSSIDKAKAENADYIVAVGHVGTDPSSSPWTSKEIISNTTGIDAFIDGHSHSTIPEELCVDKAGNQVILSSTGTKLAALGQMTIKSNGTISSQLINSYTKQDQEMLDFISVIKSNFADLEKTVVAKSEVNLVVNDPVTGNRIVRNQESNLGDLCADAYRNLLGADIGFVNGGGIRATIKAGDITYGNIIEVHPYGNAACLIEATGQQILDALELGSKALPNGESGGFLQVSGLTYEINTTIASSVITNDKGEFVKVNGQYRVNNVKVGNDKLDLNKIYKLASHNYMLKSGGDGYTMFKNDKILQDEVMIDNQVLINYIKTVLGGKITSSSIYANPYGEGRIKVVFESVAPTLQNDGYQVILKGADKIKVVIPKLVNITTPNSSTKEIVSGKGEIVVEANTNSTNSTVTEEIKIGIEDAGNIIPAGTSLCAGTIIAGNDERYVLAQTALAGIASKFTVFDISLLTANNVKLENSLSGNVKISLTIPSTYSRSALKVYRIETNGTKTDMKATIVGGNIIFETNHFSIYVLSDEYIAPAIDVPAVGVVPEAVGSPIVVNAPVVDSTNVVPDTGTNVVLDTSTNTNVTTAPLTFDGSTTMFYVIIMILATGSIATTLLFNKKKYNQE